VKILHFLGDEHDLDEFLLLQIQLLTQGKCAYLFKMNETKKVRNYFLMNILLW